MLAHPNHYQAGGANSYPAVDEKGKAGYPTTIIGSDVTFGTIVTAGFSADPLLDLTATDGPASPLMVCELPGAGMPDIRTALYGVVQEENGIDQGEKGDVASAFVTIKARVLIADGGQAALTPLMDDPASPGRLIEWAPTGKCIAKLARAVPDPGGAAAESLEWVHFNGVYGFN